MSCLKPSLEQDGNLGLGRRSGSKPPLLVSRALRWLWRDRKDAGIFGVRRFRRCTGRLNATQPGVLAVSPLYIRGLAATCKRSVAMRQQSILFAFTALSTN